MLHVLHIRLLGTFGLDYGEAPVAQVDTPRLQSLLAYLLLHAEAPQPRRYLAFRFWPDSAEKQARTNLRQLLHHLRQALPEADRFIEARTHTIQWRTDAPFTLDVAAFGQALARAEQASAPEDLDDRRQALEAAVALYRGDLLPGCYDEWIEPERERLRQQCVATLDRLVRLLERQRAYLRAIPYAGRLLQQDPLRETTYRTLMRLHALRDDRASALRVYHTCATALERELAVEPGPATRALYERLMNLRTSADDPAGGPRQGQAAGLPLVGRKPEWRQLQAAWRTAVREHACVAIVGGEAGIGKSRLAEELLTWAARQGVTTARARCYAAEGPLAFAPLADWLRAEAFRQAVGQQQAVWRTEIARILPELLGAAADLPPPEPLTEGWQRRRFFEAVARAVLAAPAPMMLLIDDLQWCDQDTLEWLHYLLRFAPGARMLLLGTVRVEEVDPAHPLEALLLDLRRGGRAVEVALGPLQADETKALAEHVAARTLDPREAAHLHRETEGNPLFVVESVRAWPVPASPGAPEEAPRPPPAPAGSLPPKVQAVLTARLAQCSPPARELAHMAAVVGRAFTFDLLARASRRDEDSLIRGLDELWRRRIVRACGADTYDFSHDKLREVAYAEVSPHRRRRLHRCVAEALEGLHADALAAVSGRLAAHYEQAGLPDRAVPHYRRAAQVAQRIYANEEAITHLSRALALLDGRPASPQREALELALLVPLGASVAATRGFASAETGRIYARARALGGAEADPHLRFAVYWGSYGFNVVRAELGNALAYSTECLRLAEAEAEPALLVAAHFAMGVSQAHLGALEPARAHLAQARAHYVPGTQDLQMGAHLGVFSQAYLAHLLWLLGCPDAALQQGREALALAGELAHPFSRVIALGYLAMLHQFRGAPDAVAGCAERALALSDAYGFPYYGAWARFMKGWALHRRGARDEGRARMQQGLNELRAIGTGLREPYYLALLAEAHLEAGTPEEGLALVEEALRVVDRTRERWQEAELHRVKGDLLLGRDAAAAEGCYHQALDAARRQAARSLELRAATRLSRLWERQGRRAEAVELLTAVCEAFTEGVDAPDLRAARALLRRLG